MKLLVALLLSTSIAFAQKQPIQSITYAQTQDIEYCSNVPHNTPVLECIAKDGAVIKKGTRLQIGVPSTNMGFTWMLNGGKAGMMIGTATQLNATYQAEVIEIEELMVTHTKASKKSLLMVYLFGFNVATGKNLSGKRVVANYEVALEIGEVINANRPMNREEAIAKLKESKDLLDLGIITQSKYDSLKSALTPIITSN